MPGADEHLVERYLSREDRLSGGYLTVVRDTVSLPDGGQATREFILHPGAVAVVPVLDDGRLVMIRQYRHPVGRVLLEWPAGKLNAQEPVLLCAQRELREETGYTAREWARIGVFHNACAYSDEGIELWLARGLHLGEQALDPGEFVEVTLREEAELLQLLQQGAITDMKTALGLLWVQRWRSGAWSPDWSQAD
ncbi:MAG: NUDIX hydrolase [Rubrivivax sp.]|nr:NUDIX hydrolase [Rubrivivax sp.]